MKVGSFAMSGAVMMVLAAAVGMCAAQAEKPNILFILADDLGFNDISLHSSPHIKTPNIDAIANGGVQFTNAYSLAGFCSPARAGFLTGKNPATFGHVFNPAHTHEDSQAGLPLDQTIIPQTLGRAGYVTSLIGKWHLGFHAFQYPIRRGFSQFFGFLGGRFDYFVTRIFVFPFNLMEYLYDRYRNPATTENLTVRFTNEAMEFITESHGASDPFFLFLSYNAPHGPLDYLEEDLDDAIPEERRPYAAMVIRLEIEIGRLMAHLRRLGIHRNTLVVFTNDNGGQLLNYASNFPFRGTKGSYLEGGVRIPMFMQWQGKIQPGQTVDHPVTLMDMFPTFQELAEVPSELKKTDLDGVDLLPHVRMTSGRPLPDNPPHEHIIMGTLNQGMVRAGVFKLWVRKLDRNETYLYNTETDPEERRNLRFRMRDLHDELFNIFKEWYSRNPGPAFPEDLRENPLDVSIVVPEGPYLRNMPITFGAEASHASGGRFSYRWEVFRSRTFHMATFLRLRSPAAPMTGANTKEATITFTQPDTWTVRINTLSGAFTKWDDFEVTIA